MDRTETNVWGNFLTLRNPPEICPWFTTTVSNLHVPVSNITVSNLHVPVSDIAVRVTHSLEPTSRSKMHSSRRQSTVIETRSIFSYATHNGPCIGIHNVTWDRFHFPVQESMNEHRTGRLLLHLHFARSSLSRLQAAYPPTNLDFINIIHHKGFVTCLIWEGGIVSPMIALVSGSKCGWSDFSEVEGVLGFRAFFFRSCWVASWWVS